MGVILFMVTWVNNILWNYSFDVGQLEDPSSVQYTDGGQLDLAPNENFLGIFYFGAT